MRRRSWLGCVNWAQESHPHRYRSQLLISLLFGRLIAYFADQVTGALGVIYDTGRLLSFLQTQGASSRCKQQHNTTSTGIEVRRTSGGLLEVGLIEGEGVRREGDGSTIISMPTPRVGIHAPDERESSIDLYSVRATVSGFRDRCWAAIEARVGADREGTLVPDLEGAARGGIEEDPVPPDGVASAKFRRDTFCHLLWFVAASVTSVSHSSCYSTSHCVSYYLSISHLIL